MGHTANFDWQGLSKNWKKCEDHEFLKLGPGEVKKTTYNYSDSQAVPLL